MTKKEAAHIVDVAFDIPQAVRRAGEDRTYHKKEIREAKEMALKALEQSCGDCINRQAAIDAIWDGTNMDIYTREVKECLEALPPVTPAERVGLWIEYSDESGKWYECDRCHTMWGGSVNYCPECGAKMQEILYNIKEVET